MKPTIAITLGDPAGVGPEIVARVVSDPQVLEACRPVVVGRRMILQAGAMACGLPAPEVEVVETGQGTNIQFGQPGPASGRQAAAFIEEAARMCLEGEADAMATAPISKEALQAAGYSDTGHTTFLARLTGVERPVMMLAGSRLKVVLATVHCAYREVPRLLSTELIHQVGLITARDFQRYFGLDSPRMAVAALNPHAGESRLFGDEEPTIIAPAVERLRADGVDASGPYPPDTIFWRASLGQFDVVLCMYHDQGLIPLKLLHFEDAVNITLGLPIIRTSVDHGTAYDLAGKGKANAKSMKSAVLVAARMASRRKG